MARLRTQRRRRKEHKTDYKARMHMLKSGKKRIVIRRTNKYYTVQAVESNQAQDKVIKTTSSKELLKHGLDKKYAGSLKSIPAAYLTGLLFAKGLDKDEYIIDLGMARTRAGNRLYALVKGLVDGGANTPANESVFPSDERINAEHLADDAQKAFNNLKEKLTN